MFLCKSGDGFNFTTSRAIGYPWLLEYMAGDVYNQTDSGKSIKWRFPSKCLGEQRTLYPSYFEKN